MTIRESARALAIIFLLYLIALLFLVSRPGCQPRGSSPCWNQPAR